MHSYPSSIPPFLPLITRVMVPSAPTRFFFCLEPPQSPTEMMVTGLAMALPPVQPSSRLCFLPSPAAAEEAHPAAAYLQQMSVSVTPHIYHLNPEGPYAQLFLLWSNPHIGFWLFGLSSVLWVHLNLYETATVAAPTSSPFLRAKELALTARSRRRLALGSTLMLRTAHGHCRPKCLVSWAAFVGFLNSRMKPCYSFALLIRHLCLNRVYRICISAPTWYSTSTCRRSGFTYFRFIPTYILLLSGINRYRRTWHTNSHSGCGQEAAKAARGMVGASNGIV